MTSKPRRNPVHPVVVLVAGLASFVAALLGVLAFRSGRTVQPWETVSLVLMGVAAIAATHLWYARDADPLILRLGTRGELHQRELPISGLWYTAAALLVAAFIAGWLAENGPHNALHKAVGALAGFMLLAGYALFGYRLVGVIRHAKLQQILESPLVLTLIESWLLSLAVIGIQFAGRLF